MNLIIAPGQQRITLFDSMRRGFEVVSNGARHVRIDFDRLSSFVQELPSNPPKELLSNKYHFFGDEEQTAGYIITLDSINFGSGYTSRLVAEGWEVIDDSIYYTLATRLKDHYVRKGMLTPRELSGLAPEDVISLLQLNPKGEASQDFARRCTRSLKELGGAITDEFQSKFINLVNWAAGSTEKMIRTLIRQRNFNDMHRYRGHAIAFHKRAQITAADLHIAFRKQFDKQLFQDINQLTLFADNLVPHVLNVEGVTTYSEELGSRIAKGEEIPSGSEEEIEIRAVAAHVTELMARQKNTIAMNIDHILWHIGTEDEKYRKTEPHRTISNFY